MDHPAAALIMELRSLNKMSGTFLGKHVLEHNINGRVYPTINQSKTEEGDGTGTGRLSITNPAMQQIPNRNKEKASIIKPCFLPDEGCVWVDSDMASFEVRVFAHLVNNAEIIQAYINNPALDLHQFVADLMGIVRSAEYSGQANAKQLNLAMIFNSGNGAIAETLGMEWDWESFVTRQDEKVTYKKAGTEATALIEAYHRRIGGIKDLATGCKTAAERRGYIFTSRGRRLRFPRGWKSYKASGILIQSTAGDINKENIKLIEDELGDEGHLILNTHDSYSMNMPEDWKPHYEKVKKAIERDRLRVPLRLDWNGTGRNWHQALQKVDNA
jgi:DNA polymerase-1